MVYRFVLVLFPLLLFTSTHAAPDTTRIRVCIIHGSKPLKAYKSTEYHMLGAMFGGHVVMQVGDYMYSFAFNRWEFHLVPGKKKSIGAFDKEPATAWLWAHKDCKVTYIDIPVTPEQYHYLENTYASYLEKCPYDYAFFGMRCAASCYKLLADAGVIHKAGYSKSIRRAFYPRPLRRKLVRWSHKHPYKVNIQQGSNTRRWEKDIL